VAQHWNVLGGVLAEPGGPALLGADNLATGVTSIVSSASNLAALFDPWRKVSAGNVAVLQREFRESVVRGVDLFASREFRLADGKRGTCASCHQTGNNRPLDVGTMNLPTVKESPELPLFRVTCNASATPHPELGRTFL
jgi:hypothetical protein